MTLINQEFLENFVFILNEKYAETSSQSDKLQDCYSKKFSEILANFITGEHSQDNSFENCEELKNIISDLATETLGITPTT